MKQNNYYRNYKLQSTMEIFEAVHRTSRYLHANLDVGEQVAAISLLDISVCTRLGWECSLVSDVQ
jgi:hypothetical protein